MQIGRPFAPMEPQPFPKPFDDPDWAFQTKWDGVRLLAHLTPGRVHLFNRHLRQRSEQYPEIAAALSSLLPDARAILDGEVIALSRGRPNFQLLLKRDLATGPRAVKAAIRQIPVYYMVFDLLYWQGKALTGLPFAGRQELLKSLRLDRMQVLITDTLVGTGTALYRAVLETGLEGVVAKRLDSPYLIGKKSRLWLKIKPKRRIIALVSGYTLKNGVVSGLLLGLYDGDRLRYIGRAGSGLREEERRLLARHLPELEVAESPFGRLTIPAGRCGRSPEEVHWVRPLLTVGLEFLEWTEEGLLRHPVITGFPGADPGSCRIEQ